MKKSRGNRPQFKFWLDRRKPTERTLIDTIPLLKLNRLFTDYVRDGLRLIYDLRSNNRVGVLVELFPDIYERLEARSEKTIVVQKVKGLEKTIRALSENVKPVETDLSPILDKLNTFMQLVQSGQLQISTPTGKTLANANMALPPPIDDDIMPMEVKIDKKAGVNAFDNFLSAAIGIRDIQDTASEQTRPMNAIRKE